MSSVVKLWEVQNGKVDGDAVAFVFSRLLIADCRLPILPNREKDLGIIVLANALGRGAVDSDEIGLTAVDLLSKQFDVRRNDFQDTKSNRRQVAATCAHRKECPTWPPTTAM